MPTAKNPITPKLFKFLSTLAKNNNRDWFNANKERYHAEVRDPLLAFIAGFEPRLHKISDHMVADARPNGGSLFRIYRDTRFARDKTPYKTAAAMTFRHAAGKDVHGPVFYLHLEPGNVFMGAGMWHPPADALKDVRDAIVEHPEMWKRVSRGAGRALSEGDALKRPPRGYDPDHPLIEDLKRKSFLTSTTFSQTRACAPGFATEYAKACRRAAPLMEFLTTAVGLPW